MAFVFWGEILLNPRLLVLGVALPSRLLPVPKHDRLVKAGGVLGNQIIGLLHNHLLSRYKSQSAAAISTSE